MVGVRVHPDGRKVLTNATYETTPNGKYNAKRKQRYLNFRNAFGHKKHILASHAVYMAWRNKEIPAGMTIDHIDGCTTNNDVRNLRCISNAINNRDGGFLRKLRNQGIKPPEIRRPYLLRYFDRMAHIKANISSRRYDHLDRADLMTILFYDLPVNTTSNSPSKLDYFSLFPFLPNLFLFWSKREQVAINLCLLTSDFIRHYKILSSCPTTLENCGA